MEDKLASELKLEESGFYKTRDGQKVGPMRYWGDYYTAEHDGTGRLWNSNGAHGAKNIPNRPEYDLIAEWTDAPTGPVRTVTRTTKEIVPGVYGDVQILPSHNIAVVVKPEPALIRAAIATLTEIAQALEEQA